jgi:glycosyltransferase involved in cell wall biosynthesis
MRCGVGDYTQRLAETLAGRHSMHVGVLTSRLATAAEPARDFEVFPVVDTWRPREIGTILEVLRRWRPDIVHVQFPTQGYVGRRLPRMLPLIYSLRGYHVVQTWHEPVGTRPLERLLWFAVQAPISGGIIVVRPNYEQAMPRWLRWALRGKTRRFIPNASVLPRVQLSQEELASTRARFIGPQRRLVAYFGFLHPAKAVEQLFRIADPGRDHLVIVGELREEDSYHREIVRLGNSAAWRGNVTLTGFLQPEEVARVIAAADAVILPFLLGGGEWNTSIHGAQAQGTFVLSTSTQRHGYSAAENTYFARPSDCEDMRRALTAHGGQKSSGNDGLAQSWAAIADGHEAVYRQVLAQRGRRSVSDSQVA